jgi:RNA polymerase II subunit A small phosphatase-like protein
MKFGKRLAGEAARSRLGHAFVDYRQLKQALKSDVVAADARGACFEAALRGELRKAAAFYAEQEELLAAAVGRLSHASSPQDVAALRAELRELRKWVALNYVAVVKAVKKRNRHLRGACAPSAVRPVSAVALLSTQHFFTSGTLAALSTRAEVLAQELAPSPQPVADVLQEYQCPIW